jgi:hypothetical protein
VPLAIVQTSGYITYRSPRCSVSQYLGKFQKGDKDAERVQIDEAGLLYRDRFSFFMSADRLNPNHVVREDKNGDTAP